MSKMDPSHAGSDWEREIAALEVDNRRAFVARDLERLGRLVPSASWSTRPSAR